MGMPLQNYQLLIQIFTQWMWVFGIPYSNVLTVNAPTQVEPCFICKKCLEQKNPSCGKGWVGWNIANYRNLLHKFPILNILETRKGILPMLFTFVPEYDN